MKLVEFNENEDYINIPDIKYIENIFEYRFLAGEGEGGEASTSTTANTEMMKSTNSSNTTNTTGSKPTQGNSKGDELLNIFLSVFALIIGTLFL